MAYINAIRENSGLDVVLFIDDNEALTKHTLYDCLNIVSENRKIYVSSLEKSKYEQRRARGENVGDDQGPYRPEFSFFHFISIPFRMQR